MKPGFILMEILIAMLVAAIVASALFSSFYQTNRFSVVVNNVVDLSTKAALVQNQLEKDLAGVFIPVNVEKPKKKEEQQEEGEQKAEQLAEKEEPEVKPITNIFTATVRGDLLNTLTFITCNPLQVYWSERAGRAKLRVARVMYRLTKEKDQKDSHKLTRQEGYDLDIDAYKLDAKQAIRPITLVDRVKSCSVEFVVVEEKKDEAGNVRKEYKTIKEWEQVQEENDKGEQKKHRAPVAVIFHFSLWNETREREREFAFRIDVPLLADHTTRRKPEKKNKQQLQAAKKRRVVPPGQQQAYRSGQRPSIIERLQQQYPHLKLAAGR